MLSKWFELKPKALKLRRSGLSLKKIETRLGIPRSTLSGWLKDVELTKTQKAKLDRDWRNALVKARKYAVLWHNSQKRIRLEEARKEAQVVLGRLDIKNKEVLDLALAMLYLGEGFKSATKTGIGNSDPLILNFFISGLEQNYGFSRKKVKCDLHLRADQNPFKLKRYWSRILKIPLSNFISVSIDQRTAGKKTYRGYKGVCVLNFATVAIQRKLIYLSEQFCRNIVALGG